MKNRKRMTAPQSHVRRSALSVCTQAVPHDRIDGGMPKAGRKAVVRRSTRNVT